MCGVHSRSIRRPSSGGNPLTALADAGAESPGESVARYLVLRDGLAVPTTQIPVATRLGTFWADLGWEAWQIALEYDGRPKYIDGDREVLVREKRRHDAMTEAGWRVLRVTKEDLGVGTLSGRVLRHLPPEVTAHIHPRRALHP
jgi:very-short-patch-repair endonuclease